MIVSVWHRREKKKNWLFFAYVYQVQLLMPLSNFVFCSLSLSHFQIPGLRLSRHLDHDHQPDEPGPAVGRVEEAAADRAALGSDLPAGLVQRLRRQAGPADALHRSARHPLSHTCKVSS